MLRHHRVVGVLALVVASLLVTASPAAAASATGKTFTLPAVSKTTYSISGTVRAKATSAVVADVAVYATRTSGYGDFTNGSTNTNASGAYTISHLLPGSYTLKFDPPRTTNLQHGYRTSTGPSYFSVSKGVAITITSASLTGKNIWLPAGYKISGKVTRANGTTVIPNAAVSVDGVYGTDDATTNSGGTYTLMGLSPGSYTVSFGHDATASNQTGCWYSTPASKFSASCASHTAVVIAAANVAGISPKIPNALKITGYVKTRASTPAPIVDAYVSANGPEDGSASTDATGKYTISGLNPGSYTIDVDGPYGLSVPDGYYSSSGPYYWTKTTASGSARVISAATTTLPTIKPAAGYYIKGKISNTSGAALSLVFVTASGGAGTSAENPSVLTDALGNYTIGPVPAGNTYKIGANPAILSDATLQQGWYLKSPPNNFTAAQSSALGILVNATKTGINMRLPKGASISGTVKLTGGSACANCSVIATSTTGSAFAYTTTSKTGAYTLPGLSAGSYYVEAMTSGTEINATHVRIITDGYYKSGAAPNFSATQAGATAILVAP